MPNIAEIDRFIFIVGAPRCGTTTMARWLQAHPQVLFPFVKEPHFFAQLDLRALDEAELRRQVEQDYLDHFFPEPEGERRIAADASVSYLYTPEQLEPVLRLWPESRFVVGVRDPLSLLPSLHKRLVFLGDETLTHFKDAWAAVSDRAAGKRIPRSCVEPRWLRYDQAGRYATYLERLFATVGREQCLVLLFDDLVADPICQYRRLVNFLGLAAMERTIDLAPRRESHDVRVAWLQRLLKRPPKPVRKYMAGPHYRNRERKLSGDLADSGAFDKVFALRKRVLKWNRIPPRKEAIPLSVQEDMRRHLKGEIERLENLIGRDLGHWLQLQPERQTAGSRASTPVRPRPSFSAAK